MTLFSPLVRNSLENPKIPISSPEVVKLFESESSKAGPFVDEKKSLSIAAVWRAGAPDAPRADNAAEVVDAK